MATITKRELVIKISNETGLTQQQVFDVIQKTPGWQALAAPRGRDPELALEIDLKRLLQGAKTKE